MFRTGQRGILPIKEEKLDDLDQDLCDSSARTIYKDGIGVVLSQEP